MVSIDPRQPTAVAIVNRLRDRAAFHARLPALSEKVTGSLLARRSVQALHAVLRGTRLFNDVACAFSRNECPIAHGDTLFVAAHVLGLTRLSDAALAKYIQYPDRPLGRESAGARIKDLTSIYHTMRQVLHDREIHKAEVVNGGGAPDARVPVLVRAAALATAWAFVRLSGLTQYRDPGGHITQRELLRRLCCALPYDFRLIAASDDDLCC
jgi:hypothetical protein